MSSLTGLDELLNSDRTAAWTAVRGKPEATLIRLALLRSFARELHSRRSKILAEGARVESRLAAWEKRLERLLEWKAFPDTFTECLDGTDVPAESIKRRLPRDLFTHVPQEKLERYDRVWEREMVAEGLALEWRVEQFQAELRAAEAESWQNRVESLLHPSALLLFVENASTPSSVGPGRWKGRWWWITSPNFTWPTRFEGVNVVPERIYPRP